MDKKDARFSQLHKTLDPYFHKLHSEGVGRQTKHAEAVSSDEDQLWEGVMNATTPTGLQNAAFFYRWQDVLPPRSGTPRTTAITVEMLGRQVRFL